MFREFLHGHGQLRPSDDRVVPQVHQLRSRVPSVAFKRYLQRCRRGNSRNDSNIQMFVFQLRALFNV